MRDDKQATLTRFKRLDEGRERLTIEVVRRLIRTHDVQAAPDCGTEKDRDLLTTGETVHGVVRDEFSMKGQVGKVLRGGQQDGGD